MTTKRTYQWWCYDQYLCVKPPLLFIVALVFLCRGFLMPLIVLLTSFKGVGDMQILVTGSAHAALLIPAVPAVFVLYALARRSPSAGKVTRWFWRNAKPLIVLSVALDVAVGLLSNDQSFLTLARFLFDAYVLIFVLASRQVRDALADFPSSEVK